MPKGVKINNSGYERCSKEEHEKRVDKATIWLLENPDSRWIDFIKWAKAKWDIQKDQANKYRKKALSALNETVHSDVEGARKQAIASLKYALTKHEIGSKEWVDVRKEINKIEGLYTQKVQIEDVSEQPIFNLDPIKASEKDNGS